MLRERARMETQNVGNSETYPDDNHTKMDDENAADTSLPLETSADPEESRTSAAKIVGQLLCCAVAGVVFGWCMEKSRVFEPASIRYQMVFKRWIMLKMFLAAVASGQLVMCLLSVLPWTKDRFENAVLQFASCLSNKSLITSAWGPFVLGVGMTLSGACPGMVLIQVGAWAKNSIFTLVGLLGGALIYGLFGHWINKITAPNRQLHFTTIDATFRKPYVALAIPMAILLSVLVVLLELFINWEDDSDPANLNANTTGTGNIFTVKSWPPSASGLIVGLLQLVIILCVGDTLGGSSGYVTVVSQWVVTQGLQRRFPYLANARCGVSNWWQVIFVGSAIIGGVCSSLSSDSIATVPGVSVVAAVCGGVLLIFGSRLAAGCTSGHGLSGMALLFWLSMVAVPCMFGGGIITGFAMQATGYLDDLVTQ